ncbi:MAG: hypothetical protein KIC88_03725 [Acinetobacter sp.]|nr:hypothetical protein [Acinetobacter sp.]DAB12849.1 MAG TPA: hypothetical protein CPT91_02255 [Candidatus Gastranaerophilales bacterium HUM_16]
MCDKKSLKLLEQRISDARMILYDLKVFIKLGALASDSGIIDDDLQLDKSGDDYYILFRTINKSCKRQ